VRRRLLNFLTALSLLLCVAVCVLWVQSYLGRLGTSLRVPRARLVFLSVDGKVSMLVFPPVDRGYMPVADRLWTRFGFAQGTYTVGSERMLEYVAPHWFVAATVGIPAFLGTTRFYHARARRKRVRKGMCPRCGYDVRATPDRCPECGMEPPPAPPWRQRG
jgi:hypothetical protein